MKKILSISLALLCTAHLFGAEKTITVVVRNIWDKAKTDAPVVIRLKDVDTRFTVKAAIVTENGKEIPSQLDDLDGDRKADELAFVTDLPAKGDKHFTIVLSSEKSSRKYPSRVYASLKIRDKKDKHPSITSLTVPGTVNVYNNVLPHGAVIESELVGYRIYFNQKQTTDLYGKFNKGLEIEACGFYPNDKQLAQGFGDDVIRVGNSCGAGTLKGWDGAKATHIEPVAYRTQRVIAYGPVRAIVEIEDNGWEYQGKELDMINRYTLYAGHRDAQVDVIFREPLEKEIFCTGVQDITDSKSYSDHKGLVASWGTDWPVNDTVKYAKETVGLATCIPQKYVSSEVKDKDNYLYTITAKGEKAFRYHTTFTSLKETFGYKTPEAWFDYVQEWKEDLEHPCVIRIRK